MGPEDGHGPRGVGGFVGVVCTANQGPDALHPAKLRLLAARLATPLPGLMSVCEVALRQVPSCGVLSALFDGLVGGGDTRRRAPGGPGSVPYDHPRPAKKQKNHPPLHDDAARGPAVSPLTVPLLRSAAFHPRIVAATLSPAAHRQGRGAVLTAWHASPRTLQLVAGGLAPHKPRARRFTALRGLWWKVRGG